FYGVVIDVVGAASYSSKNIIIIDSEDRTKPFTDHGDSGSVILNEADEIVGLLYAKDASITGRAYACHIHPVLEALKLDDKLDAAGGELRTWFTKMYLQPAANAWKPPYLEEIELARDEVANMACRSSASSPRSVAPAAPARMKRE